MINALVEKASHVPYRDSKLTRLLQGSLLVNCHFFRGRRSEVRFRVFVHEKTSLAVITYWCDTNDVIFRCRILVVHNIQKALKKLTSSRTCWNVLSRFPPKSNHRFSNSWLFWCFILKILLASCSQCVLFLDSFRRAHFKPLFCPIFRSYVHVPRFPCLP